MDPNRQIPTQQATIGTPMQGGFNASSLYIGDLHPEVNESELFELFKTNSINTFSIKICRDTSTSASLCYGYVNFYSMEDAERALTTMNYTKLHNKPVRLMWSQRDPSLRKSGINNVFVKNLPKDFTTAKLCQMFSLYGNILSAKIQSDENGKSKGFGFIH
jgi:polyadenylate-binding protein